jgi:hypothetical protein
VPPELHNNKSRTEKSKIGLYKLIAKRKPFIFVALTCVVLYLSTALSSEIAISASDEDELIENMTTFILFMTTALGNSLCQSKIEIEELMQLFISFHF